MTMQLIRNKGKFVLPVFALLFASAMFLGCDNGDDGAPGPQGPPGPPAEAAVQPESCAICHEGVGAEHQEFYDELYQDGVIEVTNLAYAFSADPDTTTITFNMTKDGEAFDCTETGDPGNSLGISFTTYTGTGFEQPARLSLKGDLTYDPVTNQCTSTLVELDPADPDFVDYVDVSGVDGLIVLYGRDERVGTLPERVQQAKYPFAALLETGAGVDYASPANVAGCEKCHTVPFLKHGYIYGDVGGDEFYTCKACHLDNGEGGHFKWQLLVDDPQLIIDLEDEYGEDWEDSGDPRLAPYAYRTRLMNDVHMAHSMEFPYPQSMANCATCHEGKLDTVLTDANFRLETCKSCHPVTGSAEYGTDTFALETIIPHAFTDATDCTQCHVNAGIAPVFSEIHTGYNKVIYADAAGTKYSEVFTVTIDDATFVDNDLTIQFSAAEAPDLPGLDVADIMPTVLVGLYGWDTKHYIIGPHERLFDDNGDGVIDRDDERALEYDVGEVHPRFTTVSAGGGSWEVTADLSAWADIIADGTVKRVEIAVLPTLMDADGVTLALNAPSRTFDLGTNAFDDAFYSPVVRVSTGCNNCHDALATTFHSPNRGGNIVVCRLCHITKAGGSHLEMQSRSIDSYVHAIHSGQAFDIGDIDFTDPVEALHYDDHIEFPFPRHGIRDCESCHNAGTNNPPDQSKSLPGILSASDSPLMGRDRNIGQVPIYVTGPASRACGGCHRAHVITEDEAGELVSFNQHTRTFGYLVEGGADDEETQPILAKVIKTIMALFE